MKLYRLACAATAVLGLSLAATEADARRVAIDLGPVNFDLFGTTWDFPLQTDVTNNGCVAQCQAQTLPFAINFSGTLVNTAFVYENGFASFGAPVQNGADLSHTALDQFGADVIAVGYTDLLSSVPVAVPAYEFGGVTTTVGGADFFPVQGVYDINNLAPNSIFNMTWNYLQAAIDGPNSSNEYQMQIQFLDATAFDPNAVAGDFDISLNFGTNLPTGALTGFKLGNYLIQLNSSAIQGGSDPVTGLYQDYVYSFRGGRLVGANTSSVPESATWTMLIAGFGLVGFAMRRSKTSSSLAKIAG